MRGRLEIAGGARPVGGAPLAVCTGTYVPAANAMMRKCHVANCSGSVRVDAAIDRMVCMRARGKFGCRSCTSSSAQETSRRGYSASRVVNRSVT